MKFSAKTKKIIASLIACTIMVPTTGSAFAETPKTNDVKINTTYKENNLIPAEFFNSDHPNTIGNPTEPQRAAGVVAVYFIPGIGQVALLVTGAIAIGGAMYWAGSWIYDVVQSYLKSETANDIISKKKKASIRKEFPTEYLDKTLNEIEKAAKKGVPRAKKAKKLLTDGRFNK